MPVIALIGDIVSSKKLTRRDVLQKKLTAALAEAGRQSGKTIASPYTITLGDEFQAVFRSADRLWAGIVGILAAIHPVQARFALGVGELTTAINPKQALGMDGPAFYAAREAITALKVDGGRLVIRGADEKEWAMANRTLAFVSHHLTGWNRNRLLILAGLLAGRSVRELEETLPISKVAIYKNVNAAALDEVVGICEELTGALNRALHDA